MARPIALLSLSTIIAACAGQLGPIPCSGDEFCPTGSYCGDGRCVALPADFTVVVSPSAAVVTAGKATKLAATSAGGVKWSVQESGGGSVDQDGTYHAPNVAGIFHVVATSVADSSKSAIAEIRVAPIPLAPAVDAPGVVTSGIGGYAAEVRSPQPEMTFRWSISGGGTLNSAQDSSSVRFTAGAPGTLVLTCTATNAAGDFASGSARVSVVPQPSIASFTAAQPTVTSGTSTTLTAVFSGGTGSVDQGIGAVTSGTAKPTGNLTATTTFTLTVTNPAGTKATRTVTVTVVPPLMVPRSEHTATRLPDDRVLVAGGRGTTVPLLTAELYKPGTGSAPTGSMTVARTLHTATLFTDGTAVLVAGGDGAGTSANLYRPTPAPGTFTAPPQPTPMVFPRAGHTATLLRATAPLANGKVLLAGGRTGATPPVTATAELYDPVTNAFAATTPSNMTSARWQHAALLLRNGKVLLTGGYAQVAPAPVPALKSAELYDPAAVMPPSFKATGNMTSARAEHTATLLTSGKVLIAGGMNCSGSGCTPIRTAELYDPETGAFSPTTGNLNLGRARHTATLLVSGEVLIAGGVVSGLVASASAELYDPTTSAFLPAGDLNFARSNHTATLLPPLTRVLITGGVGTTGAALNSVEIFQR